MFYLLLLVIKTSESMLSKEYRSITDQIHIHSIFSSNSKKEAPIGVPGTSKWSRLVCLFTTDYKSLYNFSHISRVNGG